MYWVIAEFGRYYGKHQDVFTQKNMAPFSSVRSDSTALNSFQNSF